MDTMEPIFTASLFPKLDAKFLELLRSLSEGDWSMRALPLWTVKDIAAHLLDGNLRRLSMGRDGFFGETPAPGVDLTTFLHGLNADWVMASKRLSPQVLIELLEISGRRISEYFSQLQPDLPATFAVSWAGETTSANWFDVARDYTERWHHQQQIRDAVGKQGIMTPELYAPVIATFMRVLPFAYRDTAAEPGTRIRVSVRGESGGDWTLRRTESRWELETGRAGPFASELDIPEAIAWKLFTKALTLEKAIAATTSRGDLALLKPALTANAIVG